MHILHIIPVPRSLTGKTQTFKYDCSLFDHNIILNKKIKIKYYEGCKKVKMMNKKKIASRRSGLAL